jgi:hypothetical protein
VYLIRCAGDQPHYDIIRFVPNFRGLSRWPPCKSIWLVTGLDRVQMGKLIRFDVRNRKIGFRYGYVLRRRRLISGFSMSDQCTLDADGMPRVGS